VSLALAVVALHRASVTKGATAATASTTIAVHAGLLGHAAFLTADRVVVESLGLVELLLLDGEDELTLAVATGEGPVGETAVASRGGDILAQGALALTLGLGIFVVHNGFLGLDFCFRRFGIGFRLGHGAGC
jgi:hypothetical protein